MANSEKWDEWRDQNRAKVKAYTRKYMDKMRAWLDEQKSGPCVDCGVKYPPCVMEFDHVRGEKEANVAVLYRRASLARVKAEIAKCDLVCANCHRLRTFARGWGVKAA